MTTPNRKPVGIAAGRTEYGDCPIVVCEDGTAWAYTSDGYTEEEYARFADEFRPPPHRWLKLPSIPSPTR
jgi:hypothetical protein